MPGRHTPRTHSHLFKEGRMFRFLRTLVAISGLWMVLSSPMVDASRAPSTYQVTARLTFAVSLAEFSAIAQSPNRDARLNWTTDGCSAPIIGSTGRSFDFTEPCRRHDFAYRNFRVIDGGKRWTSSLRDRVDRRFRSDMRTHCARRSVVDRAPCRAWAETFYRFVRTYAGP
jgi:hypothetical protein